MVMVSQIMVQKSIGRSLGEHGIWSVSRSLKSTILDMKMSIIVMFNSLLYTISENFKAKTSFVKKL